jgi:hypothetical protein
VMIYRNHFVYFLKKINSTCLLFNIAQYSKNTFLKIGVVNLTNITNTKCIMHWNYLYLIKNTQKENNITIV